MRMDPRRRDRTVLILLALGQFILLSSQAPSPGDADTFLGKVTLLATAPLARLIDNTAGAFTSLGEAKRSRASLRRENELIKEKLERLMLEVVRLQGAEEKADQLGRLLNYRNQWIDPLGVADVVLRKDSFTERSLLIYGPTLDLELNQAVFSHEGLVGRVARVSGPYALVQVITDQYSAVSAMIARTRQQGVARGKGTSDLEMAWVLRRADVKPGDRVLTAGIDEVYPKGLLIGVVESVEAGDDLFLEIEVTPAAEFNRLDRVLIAKSRPLPQELNTGAVREKP